MVVAIAESAPRFHASVCESKHACMHAPCVSMHHVSTCTKCQSIHACIHPCVCTHILNPKAKYKARDRTAAKRKTAQIGRQSKTDTQRPTLKTTHTGTPSAKWPASMYRSPWRQYGTGNGGAREARGMVERERSIPRASLVRKRIFSSSICQARSRHEQTAGAHVTCRTCMPQHTLACRNTCFQSKSQPFRSQPSILQPAS